MCNVEHIVSGVRVCTLVSICACAMPCMYAYCVHWCYFVYVQCCAHMCVMYECVHLCLCNIMYVCMWCMSVCICVYFVYMPCHASMPALQVISNLLGCHVIPSGYTLTRSKCATKLISILQGCLISILIMSIKILSPPHVHLDIHHKVRVGAATRSVVATCVQ